MPTSEARIRANRRNAKKSTGPRTVAGKERSRANAHKHGLTGEGVALPPEDAAAVAGRFEALQTELAPKSALGSILVHRVAMLSVRLDRSTRQETASLSGRVERAAADFDEARMAEVSRLVDLLRDDPATAVRLLRRMPEGVDRMLSAWATLLENMDPEPPYCWYNEGSALADALTGRPPQAMGTSRIEALWRASVGDFRSLRPGEAEDLDDQPRRDWGRARLIEVVEAQIADLKAHRATLDLDAIARDRARAADKALFDSSKEAILARKYEAAAERAMHRTLAQLREVESETAAQEEVAKENDPVGSFSPASDRVASRRLRRRPNAPQATSEGRPDLPIGGDGASETAARRLE